LTAVEQSRTAITRASRAPFVDKPADFFDDQLGIEPFTAPVVLVAGGPPELVIALRRVAEAEGSGIVVEECDVASVRTTAPRIRPFALVLAQDVYGFDPDRLGALAAEVEAELVVIKIMRVSSGFLEQALRPSLRHALRRYRSTVESGPVRRR
jgi:hypothetical protein